MRLQDRRDLVGGVFLIGAGAVPLSDSITYPMGTFSRLGPGFFPSVLCVLLILIGLALALKSLWSDSPLPGADWRAVGAISTSILVFGLTVDWLGLVPAISLLVAIATLSERSWRPVRTGVLAVILAAACTLVFRVALGMQMPIARWPF